MDSLINESAQPKKFLNFTDWNPEKYLPELAPWSLEQRGIVYSPSVVVNALRKAYELLVNYPGPNQEFRRQYAQPWLGWWIDELEGYDDPDFPFMKTYNIVHFDNIAHELERRDIFYYSENHMPFPAVWFVAELAGHEGSRFAAEFVMRQKIISPIIVFEQEEYLKGKERGKFFLPLALRLSMYSHFFRKRGNRVLLSINPYSMMPDKKINELYDYIFTKLHAFICLPNKDDPLDAYEGKIQRSVFLPRQLEIPHLDVPSTTERVRV